MNFKKKLPEDQEPISSQLQNDASSQTLENHTAELQMQSLVFQVKFERKMSPADQRKHSKSAAIQVQERLQPTRHKPYKWDTNSNTPLTLDTRLQGSHSLYEAYCPRVNNMQLSPAQVDFSNGSTKDKQKEQK